MKQKDLLKRIEELEKEVERLKTEKQQIIVVPISQPYVMPQYPNIDYPIKWEVTCSSK